jgi:hypothetical protein
MNNRTPHHQNFCLYDQIPEMMFGFSGGCAHCIDEYPAFECTKTKNYSGSHNYKWTGCSSAHRTV